MASWPGDGGQIGNPHGRDDPRPGCLDSTVELPARFFEKPANRQRQFSCNLGHPSKSKVRGQTFPKKNKQLRS